MWRIALFVIAFFIGWHFHGGNEAPKPQITPVLVQNGVAQTPIRLICRVPDEKK